MRTQISSGNEAFPITQIFKKVCSWISKAIANNVHLKIEKIIQPSDCHLKKNCEIAKNHENHKV